MDFNPLSREPKGKIPDYQSSQERKAANNEEGANLSWEATVETLMAGAYIVIEKDPAFTSYVQGLLSKYGSSRNIQLDEEDINKRFGRQPEMVIAVARILEKSH